MPPAQSCLTYEPEGTLAELPGHGLPHQVGALDLLAWRGVGVVPHWVSKDGSTPCQYGNWVGSVGASICSLGLVGGERVIKKKRHMAQYCFGIPISVGNSNFTDLVVVEGDVVVRAGRVDFRGGGGYV